MPISARIRHLADAYLIVSRANHYLVVVGPPLIEEELDAVKLLLIDKQNSQRTGSAPWHVTDRALDLVEHDIRGIHAAGAHALPPPGVPLSAPDSDVAASVGGTPSPRPPVAVSDDIRVPAFCYETWMDTYLCTGNLTTTAIGVRHVCGFPKSHAGSCRCQCGAVLNKEKK
jgi:hypothetical protein